MSELPRTSRLARVKLTFPFVAFWLVVAGALLAYPASQHQAGRGWLETVRLEVIAACQHHDTQWLAVVCVGIYFAGFLYLRQLVAGESIGRSPRSLLILAFTGWAAWVYARDYPVSASSGEFLTLVAALAAGQGIAFWIAWEARRAQPRMVGKFVLGSLLVMLAAASLLHPYTGMAYQYRSVARWKGLWDTPNTFGVLMAVGLVLAVGLALRASVAGAVCEPAAGHQGWRWPQMTIWLACAAATGTGLVQSYSRGAWLGAALGLAWLGWGWLQSATDESSRTRISLQVARACAPAWLLAATAAGVLAFWCLRHTEAPLVRRAFTVGNVNDFSWRNRVATWPGALEVMARKPLAGWGWGRSTSVFDQGHKPAALSEGGAVTLNNYLMVGMMLGAPALIALVSWLWLGWRAGDSGPTGVGIPAEGAVLLMLCQAALIPCAITMALDGVLFKAAVCVPMFVLLELGASMPAAAFIRTMASRKVAVEGHEKEQPGCEAS